MVVHRPRIKDKGCSIPFGTVLLLRDVVEATWIRIWPTQAVVMASHKSTFYLFQNSLVPVHRHPKQETEISSDDGLIRLRCHALGP